MVQRVHDPNREFVLHGLDHDCFPSRGAVFRIKRGVFREVDDKLHSRCILITIILIGNIESLFSTWVNIGHLRFNHDG